ncbi:pentapeptide repeat-containing protein [Actinomadura madurae]|uniref:pentapeptide repeat-containing protein n=1 Tax=Actinomadura madurae TaxID=1993 RepID=UPI002025F9FE|nr:pentapeptide repeat-containing protein [Actinomadura madurae]URN07872.1 pentapeptide repeat-containing protein [Actinomadura madurae]
MTHHEPSMPTVFWPRCRAVHGCTGRVAGETGGCAAHLRPREFERFVGALRPGADLDLRGVTVTAWLLDAVLDAVTGPDGRPHLGRTRFDGAVLTADAGLRGCCVEGDSSFDGACFLGGVSFYDARFFGNASFRGARFGRNVSFHEARFHRHASFEEVVFSGDAVFGETRWHADAAFRRAVFMGAASFDRARFGRDAAMQAACFGGPVSFKRVQVARHAHFERTRFRHGMCLGPLVAGGLIGLTDAAVHGALRVHAAARLVTARGATVHGDAVFRLRHAELDLEEVVFEGPAAVRSLPHPIQGLTEPPWTGPADVRLVSLRRADTARIVLTGVDLSRCGFLGLRRPDTLKIGRGCSFATVPGRHLGPWRGAARAVLAEDLAGGAGGTGDVRLRPLYLALARAAADLDGGRLARDFRYNAHEVRRRGERDPWRRAGLHVLWLTCGYGLRAGRAVAWIVVITALVCSGVSLVRHDARPRHPSGRAPTTAWRPPVHRT